MYVTLLLYVYMFLIMICHEEDMTSAKLEILCYTYKEISCSGMVLYILNKGGFKFWVNILTLHSHQVMHTELKCSFL